MFIEHNNVILGGYFPLKNNDGVVVSFQSYATADEIQGKGKLVADGLWVPWYNIDNNRTPENIIRVLTENNINPGILDTKRDFIIGSGVCMYRYEYVEGKRKVVLLDPQSYPEIKAWLDRCNYEEVVRRATKDILWFGNCFFELLFEKNRQKIYSIGHVDATTVRAKVKTSDVIDGYFISDMWNRPVWDEKDPEAKKEGNNVSFLPAYMKDNIKAGFPKCIIHQKEYIPGYPYYSLPSWWGAINWIKLANAIPKWHLSGIKNGYNIRWHIEVPESIFAQLDPEKKNMAKADLIGSMNRFLAGEEQVGRAFVSYVSQFGTDADRFKITPLKVDINDEAFTALFEQSNMAMTSAHGIHPTLAGVETQGKLSSGSEMRNAYLIHVALRTPHVRKLILDPLYEIKRINGWANEVEFGFENIEVTKLDDNPTGNQNIIAK